ncbi:aerobic carbon-monoxide dehydrogenase large subunit [Anaerolineales bacterium]|nr:aerobic carbon-monoxide dehydrogenase large subunit [Anaerolineales bacterium]
MPISFFVNGSPVTVDIPPATPLLDVLRTELGLTGTKQGCDHEGECGVCTVLLGGKTIRSCITPVSKAAGRHVFTVEGLGSPGNLHPLQQAFIDTGAVQCGYCTPGMLVAAKGLLDQNPNPSHEQIIEFLEGNLCRCTGYKRILLAVELAAAKLRGENTEFRNEHSVVGKEYRRMDAVDKVTGRAKYVEDMVMPGLLHGKILRSPHHHARIVALDKIQAEKLPGVFRVITAGDIPGENGLGDYSRDEPILTPIGDTVKMMGAPIAVVIAETAQQAQAGVDTIQVTYEVLPHTFEAEEALAGDAYPIYGHGNILTQHQVKHGNLEGAFDESDLTLETRYRTSFVEHSALEREASLGYIDEKGIITVLCANHEPYWHRNYIASTLALEPTQVRVITPPIGGSFGGKQDPILAITVGLAVFLTRRPVRIAYSRHESFAATPKRHPYDLKYRIGAKRNGQLTGVHVRVNVNTGAYDAHGQYIVDYAVVGSGGAYRWQAVDSFAQTIYTNGPKAGQYRGFGTTQSTFALECALDELAQKLEMDPLELRLKNAIGQSSISFLGYPIGESVGYGEVLRTLQLRYQEYLKEAEAYNTAAREKGEPFRKGVGLAGMWYRFGKSGTLKVEAHCELASDGNFVVYATAPDYGQGSNTMLIQFAAEILESPRDRIRLVNADTALAPDSGIQGASRSTYFVGGAVCKAAENLRKSIQAVASEMLDCDPAEVTFGESKVHSKQNPAKGIPLSEVAAEFDRMGRSRRVPGFFDLTPQFPDDKRPQYAPLFCTGAQVAEVLVNLKTGVVQVERVVVSQDMGRTVNPVDAQGQIEGAVLMGVGTAIMEEVIPDATTSFASYYVPTVKSMPEIETHLVEVASLHGPLGVKGIAEAVMTPTAPAIVNAISRVVRQRIREIPATPERVLEAIVTSQKEGLTL